ncbi:MAG: RNA polymerase sigma factor RpoD [Parcubacteria group bacterium CG10_big_fil_rev_8_21_14_0_10_38_31]|nr:MAG: RNA polymerase sigma factor RpoD [Parcubacteria group bacterium CG10_big_fil_rev_8_21_14_0_10_38_31]
MATREGVRKINGERKSTVQNNTVNNMLRQIKNFKLIDKDKEKELAKKIQEGDEEALHELINANLGLVVAFIKRGKYYSTGVPMEDLINYGNLGLITVAKKFDYKKGFKFSTYATHWIRQRLNRNITDNEKLIRIPIHRNTEINCMNNSSVVLRAKLSREPSSLEVSRDSGISTEKIEELRSISSWKYSGLDSPVGNLPEGAVGRKYEEVIESPLIPSPENYTSHFEVSNKLQDEIAPALSNLSDTEQFVVKKRLMEEEKMTLEEIGKILGYTREAIRLIEKSALVKLKESLKDKKEELLFLIT